MNAERFESLVARAVDSLPEEFRDRLENVDIIVADHPSREQLASLGKNYRYTLLGLYEGVPLTRRSHGYGMVMPDKITIFQKPIEAKCRSDDRIISEVRRVVLHEIAHHFGIDDARLEQLGM
jgi:predicted Zn-dependent protease with MMP-like domain